MKAESRTTRIEQKNIDPGGGTVDGVQKDGAQHLRSLRTPHFHPIADAEIQTVASHPRNAAEAVGHGRGGPKTCEAFAFINHFVRARGGSNRHGVCCGGGGGGGRGRC